MLVSVLMITYNHEQFLRQALESALMQDLPGEWEIVVGEDCSTDATRSILLEYQRNHPGRIRPLLREKNLGWMENSLDTFRACRGKYIALLEGDDLWTSPAKLRKQVEFLESHPTFSSCFHNVTILDNGQETLGHKPGTMKGEYRLEDIVRGNFIHTCSVMYRRGGDEVPDWFRTMPMGDWPTHVLNAEWGPIGYLDEVMASYRIHDGGVWSPGSRIAAIDRTLVAAEIINRHLEFRYDRQIREGMAKLSRDAAKILSRRGEQHRALGYARRACGLDPRFGYFLLVPKIVLRLLASPSQWSGERGAR